MTLPTATEASWNQGAHLKTGEVQVRLGQGAGKTCPLLLCAAGLRAPDTNIVRWGGMAPAPGRGLCAVLVPIGTYAPGQAWKQHSWASGSAPQAPPHSADGVPVKHHSTSRKCQFSREHTAFRKQSPWRPWPLRFSVTGSQGQLKTPGYGKAALVPVSGFQRGSVVPSAHAARPPIRACLGVGTSWVRPPRKSSTLSSIPALGPAWRHLGCQQRAPWAPGGQDPRLDTPSVALFWKSET